MNNELRFGSLIDGPAFFPVSGEKVDIQTISVSGYDPEEGSWGDEVNVQELDYTGKDTATYYWYDCTYDEFGDEKNVKFRGWYTQDEYGEPDQKVEGVMIAPGDGLWVNAPSTDFTFSTSGQVGTEDTATTLRFGSKMVVNATSASVNLNGTAKDNWAGVWVTGYNEEDGSWGDEVNIQKLDYTGKDTATYYWYDCTYDEFGDEKNVQFYGWYTQDEFGEPDQKVEGVTIEPGEGYWVNAPSTAFVIHFPKADVK